MNHLPLMKWSSGAHHALELRPERGARQTMTPESAPTSAIVGDLRTTMQRFFSRASQ